MNQTQIYELINLMHSKMNAMHLNTSDVRALARFTLQDLVRHNTNKGEETGVGAQALYRRILECFPVGNGNH